jgi:hypothetical protein
LRHLIPRVILRRRDGQPTAAMARPKSVRVFARLEAKTDAVAPRRHPPPLVDAVGLTLDMATGGEHFIGPLGGIARFSKSRNFSTDPAIRDSVGADRRRRCRGRREEKGKTRFFTANLAQPFEQPFEKPGIERQNGA